MQVVWEADTAAFASRKRAARACQKCRAAKKRCHHTFQRPPDQQADTDGLERVLPNLTHKEPIRFVGDLNPESILTDLSSRNKGAQRISRVGTWVEQSRDMQDSLPPEDLGPPIQQKSGEKTPLNVEKYGRVEGGRRTLTGHQRNYLQAVGAFRVLPKATQDALVTTYIACFDGLLPILNGIKLLKDFSEGRCSIFLMQAICLVTCKTDEAGPYLRLYDDGPLLDPIPFARSLHTGLDAAMKADLEPDRVTKIQILTLMHLHNDGPGGIEESSLHLSMAIHDAWTSGLHIHTPGRTLKDQSSMLWWTIWTLDKINACLGGRPIVIANRDIDISRPPLEPTLPRSNVINMWLRLGDLLDDVIEFYRPTADPDCTGWEAEFPHFDSLSEGLNLDLIHPSEKSVLELCYLVISILSCRAGGPTTASYARRISAASRIQDLLSDGKHLQVPPLPLIPYAVGLTLTVTYRGLRDNAFDDPERAQADLATRCEMLESLSTYWWTADAMARLGRKALKSLKETGVRRASVANIANAMEAEVAVCKYGPFDGSAHRPNQKATPASTSDVARGPSTVASSSGSGLHVLSDAAATHSTTGPAGKSASTSSITRQSPTTAPPTLVHTPASHSTKSPMTSSSAHITNSYNSGYSAMPPSNGTNPNINSNRPSRLPMPGFISLQPSHHTANTISQQTPYTSASMAYNPAMDAPHSFSLYDSSFNDLDNLFEGFFDLSMPTIWQDPLFDGDAFSSVDMTMGGMDPALSGMQDTVGEYEVNAGENGMSSAGTMNGKMASSQSNGGYPEINMHR
ncbi:hypothetical protein H2200_006521 [Cladophialophora chaetospira]|uniref:Xylanolytic transcriptional activator regulatory domain-containing protein n=1 Tax=Cladophialophora chaetospira TaxID=386627 RepID=A0AA38X8J2_9EURO|nr:hypothetical protein H2200_006521 [Cladophialophora chaetospira]